MPNIERPSDEISIDTPTDADSLMIKPAELGSVQEDFRQYTIEACAKILFREPSCVTTDWAELKALINYLSEHPEHTSYAIVLQPPPSGNEHFDTLLAGVAEKLADDAGISRPEWCANVKPYIQWWPSAWTPRSVHRAARYTPPQLRARNCVVDKNVLWISEKGYIEETRVTLPDSTSEDVDIYASPQPAVRTSDWWGDPEQWTVAKLAVAPVGEYWGDELDYTQIRLLIGFIEMHPEHVPYAIATCPDLTGNEHLDVYMAAIAEKLADDAGIIRPDWCATVKAYVRPLPVSCSPQGSIKALKFTPPQFLARDLLLGPSSFWNIINPITGRREIDIS
jgi:hypothetical protein